MRPTRKKNEMQWHFMKNGSHLDGVFVFNLTVGKPASAQSDNGKEHEWAGN